ncbi:hypothetical protein D1BOALGB6SA_45 [Olavius sp. associated proteobacterium Delta 1]|nr:hypothetical protein D1BOALGB6SA_45 [Olavius sp. associated proteobacterium Delta 1]
MESACGGSPPRHKDTKKILIKGFNLCLGVFVAIHFPADPG